MLSSRKGIGVSGDWLADAYDTFVESGKRAQAQLQMQWQREDELAAWLAQAHRHVVAANIPKHGSFQKTKRFHDMWNQSLDLAVTGYGLEMTLRVLRSGRPQDVVELHRRYT